MAVCEPSPCTVPVESLLVSLRPRIRATFARFRIPPEEAEDILQEALLAFVTKGDAVHSPEPWLLGTLRNRCLLYWRSRRRRLYDAVDTALLESTASGDPEHEQRELQRDLHSLIGSLPPRCRSLLRLRYGLGYEADEVADRMGYRHSSIRKVTLRCISALTQKMTAVGLCSEPIHDRSPD